MLRCCLHIDQLLHERDVAQHTYPVFYLAAYLRPGQFLLPLIKLPLLEVTKGGSQVALRQFTLQSFDLILVILEYCFVYNRSLSQALYYGCADKLDFVLPGQAGSQPGCCLPAIAEYEHASALRREPDVIGGWIFG